jgi:hypothetical protein
MNLLGMSIRMGRVYGGHDCLEAAKELIIWCFRTPEEFLLQKQQAQLEKWPMREARFLGK